MPTIFSTANQRERGGAGHTCLGAEVWVAMLGGKYAQCVQQETYHV
jgi:hypothetical protein